MALRTPLISVAKLDEAKKRIETLETENRNYTELVTNALLDGATEAAESGYNAALEIASGQLSRALMSARVTGANVFTPDVMGQIGRSIVETGEAIWVRMAGGQFVRADNYGINPDGSYQISFNQQEAVVPLTQVFHVRWAVDLASGRGVSALQKASKLRTLISRIENSLSDESHASVGYLLPLPQGAADSNVKQLRADLAKLKGQVAVIESARGNWGQGSTYAPARKDYELTRIGPSYPDSSVELYKLTRDTTLAALGYPPHLVNAGDASAQREAWRRFLHGTVSPIGRLIIQAGNNVGYNLNLSFDELFASDIQGRARAFQSLVGGGMDIEQAVRISGLLNVDED